MKNKVLYLLAIALITLFTRSAKAQISLPTVYCGGDTMLANQLHVDLTPSYNPVFMTDTAYYMTVTFYGGITPTWVKVSVWLYGKDYKAATRVDRGNMDYILTGADLAALRLYWIPYAYYYVDNLLGLTPKS